MQNGQITIHSLFDGTKVFRIPQYQRAYAWEEKQLQEFCDDFETQFVGKDYFFGTILVREEESQDEFEIIEIVDGQQRITTLMIYMKLILDRLTSLGDEVDLLMATYVRYGGRYKLHVLQDDHEFFAAYILQDNDGSEFIRTPSQRRLWEAKKYLRERVESYSLETLQQLVTKVRRTKLLTYSVEDNAEATLIFETTNDRGRPLSNLEKTKSFLMHKTYLASDDPKTALEHIQSNFIEIYRDFEAIQYKGIGEDSILQYHFIAFEPWAADRKKREYAQYVEMVKRRVNRLFAAQDHAATMRYIDKYSRELRESYGIMRLLQLNPGDYGLLDLIATGRQAVFYPLLLKTFKCGPADDKPNFKRIVRLAEIISFRVWGVRRRRADTGRDFIYRLARDFQGDFDSLIGDLRQFIHRFANDEEFRSYLSAPNLYKSAFLSDIRYLFWKYENYLRCTEMPVAAEMTYDEFLPADRSLRLAIEHIAPQNPQQSKVIVDLNILPSMTKRFAEQYLHSLGNLTIDPLSANISKSNQDFENKYEHYFRRAPFKTQNELGDFLSTSLMGSPRWDEHSVQKRRDKILKFALEYWDYRNA